jgi:hypothetical protein
MLLKVQLNAVYGFDHMLQSLSARWFTRLHKSTAFHSLYLFSHRLFQLFPNLSDIKQCEFYFLWHINQHIDVALRIISRSGK